jgi:hypothetical protein
MKLPWIVAVALVGCAGSDASKAVADTDSGGPAPEAGCNGHEVLCDRPVSQVTFAGTHNSMSNADAGWIAPNQQHGLTQQLEDGVRAFMLDTHEWEGGLWLCHSSCSLGSQPLVEGLEELTAFLDEHPREVIQIIFQDAIPIDSTRQALAEAGLEDRLYEWDPTADPTLQELIDAQHTLIVGLESGDADGQGLHAAWELWMDTPYSFADPSEFSCELNRGSADNELFLVNHWIGNPLPDPTASAEVNVAAVLEARARACAERWGRTVNFLGVDFYDRGDLFPVVDRLNGIDSSD